MEEIYSVMALFYDTLVDQKEFSAWGEYFSKILKEEQIMPRARILECGCGTGRMTKELVKSGYEIAAIDFSEEMLRIAGEKLRREGRNIHFALADMTEFTMAKPCDAVVAAYDVVNYLATEQKFLRFLEKSYKNVKPGGVLLFDFSTPFYLKEYYGNRVIFHDTDEATWIWDNRQGGGSVISNITLFYKEKEYYRRFDEQHELFIWEPKRIATMLQKTGWEEISFFCFGTERPLQEKDDRGLCIAKKGRE